MTCIRPTPAVIRSPFTPCILAMIDSMTAPCLKKGLASSNVTVSASGGITDEYCVMFRSWIPASTKSSRRHHHHHLLLLLLLFRDRYKHQHFVKGSFMWASEYTWEESHWGLRKIGTITHTCIFKSKIIGTCLPRIRAVSLIRLSESFHQEVVLGNACPEHDAMPAKDKLRDARLHIAAIVRRVYML